MEEKELCYKEAYLHLFNGVTDLIAELGEATGAEALFMRERLRVLQEECEEICVGEEGQ